MGHGAAGAPVTSVISARELLSLELSDTPKLLSLSPSRASSSCH